MVEIFSSEINNMLALPDINPFPTDLAEIGQVRKSAQPPVNIREVPPSMLPTEELRFAVTGEKGEGLVREMTSSAGVCEHLLPENNGVLCIGRAIGVVMYGGGV